MEKTSLATYYLNIYFQIHQMVSSLNHISSVSKSQSAIMLWTMVIMNSQAKQKKLQSIIVIIINCVFINLDV